MFGQLRRTTGVAHFRMLLIFGAVVTLFVVLVSQFPREARGQVTARSPRCDGVVATIVGGAGNDVLRGTQGPDVIVAQGGDDEVLGNGSDDLICGGSGHDHLEGGGGDDVLRGEGGNDALGAPPFDPTGQVFGVMPGLGDGGDDVMLGGPGDDLLFGGPGDDMLFGEHGDDWLGHPREGADRFDLGNDSQDGGPDGTPNDGHGDVDWCWDDLGNNSRLTDCELP